VSTRRESDRKRAPVFVMGCHRSGTNLIYDMLLSSGGFTIHRGYLPLYKKLIPRFGSMESRAHREKIFATWMRSKGYRRYGLDPAPLAARVLNDCRTGGDFIRAVMETLTENQQSQRWTLYDPDNVMHVEEVKRDIPNAIFLHMIRDGRDIALSLKKMSGFSPLPWDRGKTNSLVATALYWEWMVRQGRIRGSKFPVDYIEIRYEDLVAHPRETLKKLGGFIDHDLDYDRIQRAGLGTLSKTNSSFRDEHTQQEEIKPLGRWKESLTPEEVGAIESMVGDCLRESGYELTLPAPRQRSLRQSWMKRIYPVFLDGKLWLKVRTPFGRLANLSTLELQEDSVQVAESVRS
jgi:sulfotransferase family protein